MIHPACENKFARNSLEFFFKRELNDQRAPLPV